MQNMLSVLWGNYWITQPNEIKRRILLVGDSVFRQIRMSMQLLLGGSYLVDFWGGSWSTKDKQYIAELQFFLNNKPCHVKYDIVLYMDNHHSYDFCCKKDTYVKYINEISELVCDSSDSFFWVSTTLFNSEKECGKYNIEVKDRNGIAESVYKNRYINLVEYLQRIGARFEDEVHFCECYNLDVSYFLINAINTKEVNQFVVVPQIISNICEFDFEKVYIWGNSEKAKGVHFFCTSVLKISVLGLVTTKEYQDSDTLLLEELQENVPIVVPFTTNETVWGKLKCERRKIFLLSSKIEFMIMQLYSIHRRGGF